MSRLCLDTSAYSHFMRGLRPAVEAVDGATDVGVPAVVLGELRSGFLVGARSEANERELRLFLRQAVVRILDVDDAAATLYASLVAHLRRVGTPLPTNDIWIAAVALREGATVLTYDDHFRSLPQVLTRVLT